MLGTAIVSPAQMTEVVLHSFIWSDGGRPVAPVIGDSAGNLYGTTLWGGNTSCDFGDGCGVVYKLDTSGNLTALYAFTGTSDGGGPLTGLVLDPAGNLYGTTQGGGTSGLGNIYKVDPSGNLTVVYSFTGADGAQPYGGVTRDSAGNLYGTTEFGGASGHGVVFRIDTLGNESVLYSFKGNDFHNGAKGSEPLSGVIRDSAGNLFGTTYFGGASNYGTVYKLSASGRITVLHSFVYSDGHSPSTGVVRDKAGDLYGAAPGGANGAGVLYKIDTSGNFTVLHAFTGGADGGGPSAVILDSAGHLYGTASFGGGFGYGMAYQFDTSGNNLTVLYNFTGGADGSGPEAALFRDKAGNLYGTTQFGGASGHGVVFELKP
jgi:uncharacterized repeat protein (TIGR03803 family)